MISAGQTVSHYRVLRQLGAGGMGVVLECFSHDGKKLAILRGRTNRDVVLIRDTAQ